MGSKCWHAENMTKDIFFCMTVKQILCQSNCEAGEVCSFGNAFKPASAGSMFFFDVQKEQLQSMQSRVRKWRVSVTYDHNLGIFVPVSKVDGKQVQCGLCRANSTKRGSCQNELSCRPLSSRELLIFNDATDFGDGRIGTGINDAGHVEGMREHLPIIVMIVMSQMTALTPTNVLQIQEVGIYCHEVLRLVSYVRLQTL